MINKKNLVKVSRKVTAKAYSLERLRKFLKKKHKGSDDTFFEAYERILLRKDFDAGKFLNDRYLELCFSDDLMFFRDLYAGLKEKFELERVRFNVGTFSEIINQELYDSESIYRAFGIKFCINFLLEETIEALREKVKGLEIVIILTKEDFFLSSLFIDWIKKENKMRRLLKEADDKLKEGFLSEYDFRSAVRNIDESLSIDPNNKFALKLKEKTNKQA